MCSDASAALGVVQRQSLEKDDNYWFVQSLNARKVVQYAKVSGGNTPADVCTKDLNAELMAKHVSVVDGRYSAGRSTLSPEVLGILHSVRSSSCTRNSVQVLCVEGNTSA